MFYYLVRPLARLGTLIFFRKIYFSNEQRLPLRKPVILAINHPTGFMEPIIMAVMMRQGLHFLVRGDFFSKKIYGALLRALHMIPLFRMRDKTGFSGVKSNYSTFEACFAGLNEGKIIMIFPEGSAIHEKRLRPLQKGLTRIAFGTLERYPAMEELYIVPVGANFLDALAARSEVMINFGEPIKVRDHYRHGDPSEGDRLLQELEQAMRQLIVIVEDPQDDVVFEQLLTLDRSTRTQRTFPLVEGSTTPVMRDKAIADWLNSRTEADKNTMKAAFSAYFQRLTTFQLNDRAVCTAGQSSGLALFYLALGFLPAWLGRGFAYLPAAVARYIKDQVVRRLEYKMPIWACANWGTFLVYYLIWLLTAIGSGQWWILGLALGLGGFAYFGLYYFEYFQQWRFNRRFASLSPDQQRLLQAQRSQLVPFLQQILG